MISKLSPRLAWITSAILVVLIAGATFAYRSANERYYLTNAGGGVVYKIDRRTGKTWIVRGTSLTEVASPEPDRTLTELPTEALKELQGRGSFSYQSLFGGSIYNGSIWHIRKLEIHLTTHSKSQWSRSFLADVSIAPASTGTFQVDTLDGHIVDIEGGMRAKAENWHIVAALGYKE